MGNGTKVSGTYISLISPPWPNSSGEEQIQYRSDDKTLTKLCTVNRLSTKKTDKAIKWSETVWLLRKARRRSVRFLRSWPQSKAVAGQGILKKQPVTTDFALEESLEQASLTFCPGYRLPGHQKLTVTVTPKRNVF